MTGEDRPDPRLEEDMQFKHIAGSTDDRPMTVTNMTPSSARQVTPAPTPSTSTCLRFEDGSITPTDRFTREIGGRGPDLTDLL
ncbi:hypothetical protein ABZS81_10785 [Streptomyces sp. NPDC005318]|uniref:hypothetical protein n=1 Tax=Streptomyces sp. NPDC005318 TaxID=3157031 RepID=UPI0033BB8732